MLNQILVLQPIFGWLNCIILTISFYFIYRIVTKNSTYFQDRGIAAASPTLIIGNLYEMLSMGDTNYRNYLNNKFGDITGMFIGWRPMYVIGDPAFVKELTIKQFNNAVNRGFESIGDMAPLNIFFAKGNHWKELRHILTPVFSTARLKEFVPMVESCALSMCETIDRYMKKDGFLVAKDISAWYTLDAVAVTLFGVQVNSAVEGNDNEYVRHMRGALAFLTSDLGLLFRFLLTILKPLFDFIHRLGLLPGSAGGMDEHRIFFFNVLKHIAKQRKNGKFKQNRKDLMSLLFDAHVQDMVASNAQNAAPTHNHSMIDSLEHNRKRKLTLKEIVANADVFLLAGFETTATTMQYTFYSLAANPGIQHRLYEEIMNDYKQNAGITYDTIMQLPYLDACINETLRLYNPGTSIDRIINEKCEIQGMEFDVDSWILINIDGIHHDERFWPEPNEYRPERFLYENRANIVPYSFIPFGEGPRKCIGIRLAYMESKIAIYHTVRQFHLETCEHTQIPLTFLRNSIVKTPAPPGIIIKATRRLNYSDQN